MNVRATVWLALLLMAPAAAAQPDADRAGELRRRFMAPCCWHETLAEHRSPEATALKAEIDAWVAAGVSSGEIENRLVSRYGRRILTDPGGAKGAILRAVPFVVLGLGAVCVVAVLRRWLKMHPAPAV